MRKSVALTLTGCVTLLASASSQTVNEKPDSLRAFLQQFASKSGPLDTTTRYISAPFKFNEHSDGALVYIEGRDWCGSGGCPLLVLVRNGSAYRIITETSVTQLPIRKLRTSHNGMPDIALTVAGGGILRGYAVTLRFNGRTYPKNPTLEREARVHPQGETLITNQSPTINLYP